jgi:hypothetical protein
MRLGYGRYLGCYQTPQTIFVFLMIFGHIPGSDSLFDRHCLPRHAHAATSPTMCNVLVPW